MISCTISCFAVSEASLCAIVSTDSIIVLTADCVALIPVWDCVSAALVFISVARSIPSKIVLPVDAKAAIVPTPPEITTLAAVSPIALGAPSAAVVNAPPKAPSPPASPTPANTSSFSPTAAWPKLVPKAAPAPSCNVSSMPSFAADTPNLTAGVVSPKLAPLPALNGAYSNFLPIRPVAIPTANAVAPATEDAFKIILRRASSGVILSISIYWRY